jgi:alpha-tubulin suppressor-like RCC1 family protein
VTSGAARLALVLLLVVSAGCGGDRITPPQQQPPPAVAEPPAGFLRFTAISASGGSACGVTPDGGTYCWGSAFASNRPVRLHTAPAFVEVDVQTFWENLMCGVTAAGTAHCRHSGQSQFTEVVTPGPVSELAGGAAICARTHDGTSYCWTYTSFVGVLGNGTGSIDGYIVGTPVTVAGGHDFTRYAGADVTTCGITTGARAFCWGPHNHALQIGDGSTDEGARLVPSPVAGGHLFSAVSVGPSHVCAIAAQGAAWCWGLALLGRLGNPDAPTEPCPGVIVPGGIGRCAPAPARVAGGHSFVDVAAGGIHTCALDTTGRAWCWGSNAWGELGVGQQGGSHTVPMEVAGALSFRALAAGDFFTCGIALNDATYCWGTNHGGRLGAALEPGAVRPLPQPVALP